LAVAEASERVTQERDRNGAAAQLLRYEREIEQLEPRSPVLFGDDEARDAHLGEALPERDAALALAVEDLAHLLGRALPGDEAADCLLEKLLLFGQREIHPVTPFAYGSLRASQGSACCVAGQRWGSMRGAER
jgi:hypothetical protein